MLRWLVPHWLMGPGDSVDLSRSGGPGDETGQGLREPCPHSTLLTPETQMSWSMVTEMLKPALKQNYSEKKRAQTYSFTRKEGFISRKVTRGYFGFCSNLPVTVH